MGNNAIRDLDMAGGRWEICENPVKPGISKVPTQQTFQTNRVSGKPVIVPPSAPITLETVKSMVTRPNDIDSLLRMIGEFNHPLRNGVTNVVMPNIAKKPNGLVIITDLPSSDDDMSGQILSGAAGEMVDKMLSAIDMSRENVSVVPLLFWRTPGGRTPNREEIDLSMPFVNKIMEMLNPRVVITFGTLAASEIAKIDLTSGHGSEIESGSGYTIFPLYHPNYLILKPSAKKDVWSVLQNIQKLLKNQ